MIDRIFNSIPEGEIEQADEQAYLISQGYSSGSCWEDLLQSKRILIVSEAGSGKTYECQNQCKKLWEAGEPAFFLELASLATGDFNDMLSLDEETRLAQWLSSQSEIATFFLDSYDELKLSRGSFEQALKRLQKLIAGRLDRARIIITTRPIPFDEKLVRRLLPIPSLPASKPEVSGENFAQIAIHGEPEKTEVEKDKPADWTTVALQPFSDEQIVDFARMQGVSDPEEMLDDLKKRNALEFARRPQDLIELSADWRDHKRIRYHKEQVEGNIRIKLKPREDRAEPAELSVKKAMDGSCRLALAMMMTGRFTIRHSAEADSGGSEVAFDPAIILPDWTSAERKALLERPLFGFASYGRVRFHHRSVMEYLAAERILSLRSKGMSARALRRLIFVETRGETIVRHSKRAIAGWLALSESMIFETLRDNEPDVLLNEGDPECLSPQQRLQTLRKYVERYGKGGWRGISVPNIKIHRFSSSDLADEINLLWSEGIENYEIREVLLQMIKHGSMTGCSNIAYNCASDNNAEYGERRESLDCLALLEDRRLPDLVIQITEGSPDFSEKFIRIAVMRLFPKHLSIPQLLNILPRLKFPNESVRDLMWHLSNILQKGNWSLEELEEMRCGLTEIISKDLRWDEKWPHYYSSNTHLCVLLSIVCLKLLREIPTLECLRSSVMTLILIEDHDSLISNENVFQQLLHELNGQSGQWFYELFWVIDSFMQSLNPIKDTWLRYVETTMHWKVNLIYVRDYDWMKRCLSDASRASAERALVLEAILRINHSDGDRISYLSELKSLVPDDLTLSLRVDEWTENANKKSAPEPRELKHAERKKIAAQKQANELASWEEFWKELANDPENAFLENREENTAWNLWLTMCKAGSRGRESGWNRQFIESYFSKDIADLLRLALMRQWRKDRPTLRSERSADSKGTYIVRWQLGLAAIYAESEDKKWATKISGEEAKLAMRYTPIELNSLPPWVEDLVECHSDEIKEVLGNELLEELNDKNEDRYYSMLLQEIGNSSSSVIKLVLPLILNWLDVWSSQFQKDDIDKKEAERLAQVTKFLSDHGDDDVDSFLSKISLEHLKEEYENLFCEVWIPLLVKLDPEAGIEILEMRLKTVIPSQRSEAVILIGSFFNERCTNINFDGSQSTPKILLRLMRLIYEHVRPVDDVRRNRCYSPDCRDEAERARGHIVNLLLALKGQEGRVAKLEMATDPLCSHFKDRILAMAEESWAEEVDADKYSDEQAIALDKSGEAPPKTNEAMFSLMVDRLEDLDDLLLQDISPRESWAKNAEEKIMRRDIARELAHLSRDLYKIDQEAVTADEKETDIRLRSTASSHEAVIELKLADKRSAKDLLETIEDQLVTKYMASETSRSGCLLITVAKQREWDNPNGGSRIDFSELVELLRIEAARVVEKHGRAFQLHVHAFDLNSRLPTEIKKE